MARATKAGSTKTLVFGERTTIRFDEDVRALANASVERGVAWTSIAHAVNASMRHALLKFKPETLTVRVDPFEQVVFSKPRTRKANAKGKITP